MVMKFEFNGSKVMNKPCYFELRQVSLFVSYSSTLQQMSVINLLFTADMIPIDGIERFVWKREQGS